MDKIKQKTPKHEAETCWITVLKQQLEFYYFIDIMRTKFRDFCQNREI